MNEQIAARQEKILNYAREARTLRLEELPEYQAGIVEGEKALIVTGNRLQGYVLERGLWRRKAEADLGNVSAVHRSGGGIQIVRDSGGERIHPAFDAEETNSISSATFITVTAAMHSSAPAISTKALLQTSPTSPTNGFRAK